MATYTKQYDSIYSGVIQAGKANTKTLAVDLSAIVPSGQTVNSIKLRVNPFTSSAFTLTVNGTAVTKNVDNEVSLTTSLTQNVTLYARNTNSSGTHDVNWNRLSVTVDYGENIKKPKDPVGVTLAANAAETSVKISWTAPESADNNPITGYVVEACDDISGSGGQSWGAWSSVATTNASTTSAICNVNSTVGGYRKFRVRTVATDTDKMYSSWVETGMVKTIEAEQEFEQQPVTNMPPYRVVHIWRRTQ